MDEVLPITCEMFHNAIVTGDLQTVRAYFQQPHIVDEVRATNQHIIAMPPDDLTAYTRPDGSLPWFLKPKKYPSDTDNVPLLESARQGHAHVIEWIFSDEQIPLMGETLTLLLRTVAAFDERRPWNQTWTSQPVILEVLLSSSVFCDLIPNDMKQLVLDDIAGYSETLDVLNVAISHGAQVNEALPTIAKRCTNDHVAELEKAGALLVGADVVRDPTASYMCYPHISSFLACGIDRRGPEKLLLSAMDNPLGTQETIDDLLAGDWIDVDARDTHERTALMHLAGINPTTDLHPQFEDPTPRIAWSLIEFSDVDARDRDGRSALHYAVQNNHRVAEILLASGADANARDNSGRTALDGISDGWLRWSGTMALVDRLLARGADPLAMPQQKAGDHHETASHVSFYDRIRGMEMWHSFIRDRPQYFDRSKATLTDKQ